MVMFRNLFNLSYQRTVVPDYDGFFETFYEKLIQRNPIIAKMFLNTDMKKQGQLLRQSITYMTSFSATLEPSEELDIMAKYHGLEHLNLPAEYFDVWLNCLIETVKEKDPEFDEYVDKAWRTIMAPGTEYMKSFCSTKP